MLQIVLKCTLKLSTLGAKNRSVTLICPDVDLEGKFLSNAYEILLPALRASVNDTTRYSPLSVTAGQKSRGSSLETSAQRKEYVSLCSSGVTGQVLNISFKNIGQKGTEDPMDQALKASETIIKFITTNTKFSSEYSEIEHKAAKLNWEYDKNSTIPVPGGLLFQFLTVLLLSYRSVSGIILVCESYGGKKRGDHPYWNFNGTEPEHIENTIKKLKEAEKDKIPFIIQNVFKVIKDSYLSPFMTKLSVHWGIGCDAKGSKLENDDKSFLVCQPVTIAAIDEARLNETSKVFQNPQVSNSSVDFSAVTREAAHSDSLSNLNSNSDSDSDSDSNENNAIRHRYGQLFIYLFIYLFISYLFIFIYIYYLLMCQVVSPFSTQES